MKQFAAFGESGISCFQAHSWEVSFSANVSYRAESDVSVAAGDRGKAAATCVTPAAREEA